MTDWWLPENDHPLGLYNGQPVMEGEGGRLVYDSDPKSGDSCLIPVPHDFLGIPQFVPGIEEGEFEPEAGS
jgi:hypothetical protein